MQKTVAFMQKAERAAFLDAARSAFTGKVLTTLRSKVSDAKNYKSYALQTKNEFLEKCV
jgi:hypothetical protein